jgi:hypothetical protein
MLVFAQVGDRRVFYQVTDGVIHEETLEDGRHGFHVATAAQIGALDVEAGFVKFPWLPPMNAPVFAFPQGSGWELVKKRDGELSYGVLPTTEIPVVGDVIAAIDHHIAVLGTTGSGKTELAFDIIRHAAHAGVRVVCIDLTARYSHRLADLQPVNLSLDGERTRELGEKMFDAETGSYGAGAEKRALKEYRGPLRESVRESMQNFWDLPGDQPRVGLISLEEISNTKATLAVTELFLSTLLEHAKARRAAAEKVLVVLEEAHTLVPEASTMGLGDYDSRGMVAKIAQIALQGRKYGVGLLVVAQRTATVSKSILTQCNTVISFCCIDDTSINFLKNVFGEQYAGLIPNLRSLQAIGYGKGIRAERPVLFEVPFSESKKRAADEADGRYVAAEAAGLDSSLDNRTVAIQMT